MTTSPKENNYHMPAEWEQHECCWMQWPHDNPEFNSYAKVPTWSHFDIEKGRIAWANVANSISNFESVKMIVHPNNITNASKLLNGTSSMPFKKGPYKFLDSKSSDIEIAAIDLP